MGISQNMLKALEIIMLFFDKDLKVDVFNKIMYKT